MSGSVNLFNLRPELKDISFQLLEKAKNKTENDKSLSNELVDNFSTILKKGIESVNNKQITANKKMVDFAMGKVKSIHEVTIAAQKAKIAMDLAVAIRSQFLKAYQSLTQLR